jgi:hypothetical protein
MRLYQGNALERFDEVDRDASYLELFLSFLLGVASTIGLFAFVFGLMNQ